MRLSSLLQAFPEKFSYDTAVDPTLTRLTADSRQVIPGALFVAVRGETVDGHRFIPQAIANGAAAIVAEHLPEAPLPCPCILTPDTRAMLGWLAAAWHGFPSRQLVMMGVTGTDGKTTTSSLIHAILQAAGLRAGLISTVSAVIGDEVLDTGFHVTTPEALEVQGYLAQAVAAGLTHCVLETTSHGLAQQRVTGCDYDIAVITNITHEHLNDHKTFENYRAAKAMLFEGLTHAAPKPGVIKTGILNHDDSSFEYLAPRLSVRRLTYSRQGAGDVWASEVRHLPAGMHFTTHGAFGAINISTPLIGEYNIANCLAAIAATVGALGLAPEAAQRGIAMLRGVPGRMERIEMGQAFTAIVDFAHTPNALLNALRAGRQLAGPKRVIAVFGSAGLRDIEKRRMMAETAAQHADLTLLTAEDPRTEALDGILEMMAWGAQKHGGIEGQTFFRVPDRGEAIRLAVSLAQPGDVVLACGKGHEQSMCFGTIEYPWDDRVAMRWALAELLGEPPLPRPTLPTTPQY